MSRGGSARQRALTLLVCNTANLGHAAVVARPQTCVSESDSVPSDSAENTTRGPRTGRLGRLVSQYQPQYVCLADGVRQRKGGMQTVKNLPQVCRNDFGSYSVATAQLELEVGDSAILWKDLAKCTGGEPAHAHKLQFPLRGVTAVISDGYGGGRKLMIRVSHPGSVRLGEANRVIAVSMQQCLGWNCVSAVNVTVQV